MKGRRLDTAQAAPPHNGGKIVGPGDNEVGDDNLRHSGCAPANAHQWLARRSDQNLVGIADGGVDDVNRDVPLRRGLGQASRQDNENKS